MSEFTIQTELWLPRPRHEVFPFFAEARNLEALTPPWLKFEVLTPAPIEMQKGTLIDYRIRVHGLPIRWRTEITAWDPRAALLMSSFAAPTRFGITRILSRSAPAARSVWIKFAIVRAGARLSIGCSCGAISNGSSSIASSG